MRRTCHRICLSAICLLGPLSAHALGQTPAAVRDTPSFDVSLSANGQQRPSEHPLFGLGVTVSVPAHRLVSVVADVTWSRAAPVLINEGSPGSAQFSQFSLLGGVRLRRPGRVMPFVEVLAGWTPLSVKYAGVVLGRTRYDLFGSTQESRAPGATV